MKIKKFAIRLAFTLGMILMLALPVWAAAPLTGGNIVNFGDTEVPVGTTVKNVLVIGGHATIAGTISDEVMVINGNLTLLPSASVRDHAIVLGGNLLTEEGAQIGKGVFRIGGDFAFVNMLMAAGVVTTGLWIVNAIITAILLIWPVILAWIWRSGVEDVSAMIRGNIKRTIAVGGLGLMTMLVLIVMLAISIVGIPVAVLVMLLGVSVFATGIGGMCHAIGHYLPLLPEQDKMGRVRVTFVGAVMTALLYNVPALGFLALFIVAATAVGGIILKVFKKKS
ncbi:hypothetical protein [Pelosinus sp. UFO1]|uniref:hypothetical protein n=1 Tax=Pelosinus sp. UFO1 TaxID=484770 RepID=UPI0004D0BF2D|nr:hypothetical protein [Pelosinus sp. UFO1]AIF50187.1 hypothetical protein UFO1_0632 [Pelosinus sp. UFO1]